MSPLPLLSLLEARILGTLVEKQITVPDTYPLSLNALTAGCNQKTSRHPILNVRETEILAALDTLRLATLIVESSGGRVTRYAHNIDRVLALPSQSVALLATLTLRGEQTAAELRSNSERLHRFADVSAVEGFLDELAQRPAGALVAMLPKAPGSRENRWTHLLCGAPPSSETVAHVPTDHSAATLGDLMPREVALLRSQINHLTSEVDELRAQLQKICAELGISP